MAGANKLVILLPFLLAFSTTRGGENGESVLLVFNNAMAASKKVAEHYASLRGVPPAHIIGLDLPDGETISRGEFETRLQQPLWEEAKKRGLFTLGKEHPVGASNSAQKCAVADAKIRYAVLCYGVPLKIMPDDDRKEEAAERMPPELRRNEAAVDSELALLPLLDQKPPLAGVIANPAYLATNRATIHPTNGVLIVARVDGPTPEIASALVDKAIQAENEGLWGRAYFDLRGLTNGPIRLGDDFIRGAAEAARAFGFETVLENSGRTFSAAAPLSDIAFYFGWYDQSVSGPFTNGMAQFRPGAVAYHLHSYSSRALRTDIWWTGPLLAAGAAATMGCTEEPYLQTTVQVNLFMARFLFLGFSFGEAAYAAQPVLSWQNTIIGDPLYRPFAKSQQQRHAELEARQDKNLEWSLLMWINYRLAQNAPLEEIRQFYAQNPQTKTSAVLQEKLADLLKSRGKLLDAVQIYEEALKLPMQPIQRLRVTLSAAALLSSLGEAQRAYDLYQEVLRENPAYPDKKDIYDRLARVAARLKKTGEEAEFRRLAK